VSWNPTKGRRPSVYAQHRDDLTRRISDQIKVMQGLEVADRAAAPGHETRHQMPDLMVAR
jgi:hypothetical protein